MAKKTSGWRAARRDAILRETRRTGCSIVEAIERVNRRVFGETAPERASMTESAGGKKKLRETLAAAAASPAVEELAKMTSEQFEAASAGYWADRFADVDAQRADGRSPFWRGMPGGAA